MLWHEVKISERKPETMRLLFLSQAKEVSDQQGYHDAIVALQQEGLVTHYENIPFLGFAHEHGWAALWAEVVERCRKQVFDVVFFQYFHGRVESPLPCLQAMGEMKERPLIIATHGDPIHWLWRPVPQTFRELSCHADLIFLSSVGSFLNPVAKKSKGLFVFMPHGFSDTVWQFPAEEKVCRSEKEFDVVFVGSRGRVVSRSIWMNVSSWKRQLVVNQLWRRYGKRFGLFGFGWKGCPAWQGPIPYREQLGAFQRGHLVVDARPVLCGRYYASDRPFFVTGSGVPLVQHYTEGFEHIFAPDENAYYIYRDADVTKVCDRVLEMDAGMRRERVLRTMRLTEERHLNRIRMRDMLMSAKLAIVARQQDRPLTSIIPEIPMSHFLPSVDLAREREFAIAVGRGS